jgi:capsular polysaccharide transport system permease protein
MLSASELIRSGYFGAGVHPHYAIGWLLFVCMVQTLVGLYLCRLVEVRVEHE